MKIEHTNSIRGKLVDCEFDDRLSINLTKLLETKRLRLSIAIEASESIRKLANRYAGACCVAAYTFAEIDVENVTNLRLEYIDANRSARLAVQEFLWSDDSVKECVMRLQETAQKLKEHAIEWESINETLDEFGNGFRSES